MIAKNFKKELLDFCWSFVKNREKTVQKIIESNTAALENETKSSAGDKHETGRAMLQLEMEKASLQLGSINEMKATLSKISPANIDNISKLGSIIYTDNLNYFLSISAGKVTIDNYDFFCISPQTPIGKILLGKSTNAKISFNNTNFSILAIK